MKFGAAPTGNEVARCVLDTFASLPSKRKPLRRTDGKREWVPLSGIVMAKAKMDNPYYAPPLGMKCLPRSKISQAKGTVLHDWHAEILAVRAFNCFLVDECARLTSAESSSSHFIRLRTPTEITEFSFQPFEIPSDVSIYMYCSEAPCGDASMELTMQAQNDPTPWDNSTFGSEPNLRGRGYFSELGAVRRKPARSDAPETLSKSCTDKLSLYQCTSILNSVASILIAPDNAYIENLVLPVSQHVPIATQRAFSRYGRMVRLTPDITGRWANGQAFRPFNIQTTSQEFLWSRRSHESESALALVPSNISVVYTPYFQETLVGGVLQGRKPSDPRGASAGCRKRLWHAVTEVAATLDFPQLGTALRHKTYAEFKTQPLLAVRRKVKADVLELSLKGWISNDGDDDFGLEENALGSNGND